jgi:hypothetical protein
MVRIHARQPALTQALAEKLRRRSELPVAIICIELYTLTVTLAQLPLHDPAQQMLGHDPAQDLAAVNPGELFLAYLYGRR